MEMDSVIFNKNKFLSMISQFLNSFDKNDDFNLCLLFSLLYIADFNYYELYEKSLSGESYIRDANGVVPLHFFKLFGEYFNENFILNRDFIDFIEKIKVDLSQNEFMIINDVINKFKNYDDEGILNYVKGDIPWRIAEDNQAINYEAVFYRESEYSIREYND